LNNWRYSTGQIQTDSQNNNQDTTRTSTFVEQNIRLGLNITSQPEQTSFDHWGNTIGQKKENVVRIVFKNINSLPQEKSHNKNEILFSEIIESNADVYCAAEVNIAWQNIDARNSLYERCQGKFEFSKSIYANNRDSSYKGSYQPGGTMLIAQGNICGRICETGKDGSILQ
jgi:hypothetical protein